MDPKEFGAKLRGKRKECKLSYQELAERCHVNHGYIRQLEAGNKLPSVSLLFIICDVLGTSPNYLFGYTEDNADKELLERIYQLTPEGDALYFGRLFKLRKDGNRKLKLDKRHL